MYQRCGFPFSAPRPDDGAGGGEGAGVNLSKTIGAGAVAAFCRGAERDTPAMQPGMCAP